MIRVLVADDQDLVRLGLCALLSNEPFVRNAVDQAIASLTTDCTMQALLKGSKFPATPVK